MRQPTCGEILVELLEDSGIDTVFGIPGVHTVELYRGLPNTRIRHVTPRHEQGAGFMADGFARASGRPAACFIITGPGMTNIATAMGQAYGDSVPLLVISSVNETRELGMGEGRLHELPSQRELTAGLTAFSHTLLHPADLPDVLTRAFDVFHCARPRPVHIELPLDVIGADAKRTPRRLMPRGARPVPDRAQLEHVAELLRNADRPLLVLGGGVQNASVQARRLVARLGIPTVTTINGKGVLRPEDPLNVGSTISQPPILDELRHADVVLAVGTELGETDTLLSGGRPQLDGALIRIDIDPHQLGTNARCTLGIVGDAGAALDGLTATWASGPAGEAGKTRAAALRHSLAVSLTPVEQMHRRVLDTIDQALPNAIVVGDSTQLVYSGNLFYQPRAPRSWFNSATGYGTLGYALSAALGAKLACPERPVVSIIGDGGLMFTIGELATAVELGLPVAILVWNNRGYGEIKKYMVARGIPPVGVDIHTPDLCAIAAAFGCRALRARSLDELGALLGETQHTPGPTVIEVHEADTLGW
jgi:acetolactate synthase I/II/III large subunit